MRKKYSKFKNLFVAPERFFIIVGLVFGLLFVFLTPPFQGSDEAVHYMRAYHVSEGGLVIEKSPESNIYGGYLTSEIGKLIKTVDSPSVKTYPNLKYDIYNIARAKNIDETSNKVFYDFTSTANYPPVAYAGSVISLIISQIIELPLIAGFYLARLGNLLLWLLLIYFSIKIIPFKKWAVVLIGLLPMMLFQASTINGDVMTVGSIVLLSAYILRLANSNNILIKKDYSIITLLLTVMLLTKPVMVVFLPIVLLAPLKLYGKGAIRCLRLALMTGIPLLTFLVWHRVSSGVDLSSTFFNQQDPSKQLAFIIDAPHSFMNVLVNTYFYTWGDYVHRSFIGVFGWADTMPGVWVTVLGFITLGIIFLTEKHKKNTYNPQAWKKIMVILAGVGYWIGVNLSLYLYYSPVGFKIVHGLQGRYFIPLLVLPILLNLSINQWVIVKESTYLFLAKVLPITLLVLSIITLYVRYYVNNV